MSKEVKRYDHAGDHCGPQCGFEESADGDWIRASDYDALLEENQRLESAWKVDVLNRKDELIAKQEKENDRVKAERDALLAERGRLKEALAAMLEIHGVTQRYADTHIEIPQSWVDVSDFARAALQGEQQ